MMRATLNSKGMKQINTTIVLNAIRSTKFISRNDLAHQLGLTPATITNIVNELISGGYIVESSTKVSRTSGRRPISLSINPEACYFIGVELSASKVVGLLTDFEATICSKEIRRIDPTAPSEVICDVICDVIEAVIVQSGVKRSKIYKIGLVVPGPYDIEQGLLIAPPNLPKMVNVPLKAIVEQRTGIPVLFEHHVHAAAFGEYWLGDAVASHCLLLCAVLEIGISGSVLIDGQILHGYRNSGGELGHMVIDPNGPKCSCGNYGCLEAMAEARVLVKKVRLRFKEDRLLCEQYGIVNPDDITLDYVIEAAEEGEGVFRTELRSIARYVGQALWNCIKTVGPDTLILAGELPNKSTVFVNEIKDCLRNKPNPLFNNEIEVYNTRFKQDSFALGAVALAMADLSKCI